MLPPPVSPLVVCANGDKTTIDSMRAWRRRQQKGHLILFDKLHRRQSDTITHEEIMSWLSLVYFGRAGLFRIPAATLLDVRIITTKYLCDA